MENSVCRPPTAGRRMPRPWAVVAILLVLAVVTFTGGTARAGSSGPDVGEIVGSSGPSVSEMVWPEGIPGTTPGVKGDFELRLNIGERGDVRSRAGGGGAGPVIRPVNNRLMAQEPLKVSDLLGQAALQFTLTESELAGLEVPSFGERQRRFSDQCRFFDDRRDRGRRDRDCRDEDRRDRDRRDRDCRDEDRRDRDRRDRDCRDEDRRDRDCRDEDRRDRDCRDEEDEDRRRDEEG